MGTKSRRSERPGRSARTASSGSGPAPGPGTYERIYATVRRIPKGRVATYGQVARLAGLPGRARQIGYALSALPEDAAHRSVPWHRVVNAQGAVSLRAFPGEGHDEQRRRLEAEGVELDARGRLSLRKVQWRPRGA